MPLADSDVSDFVAEQQKRQAASNDAAGFGVAPQAAQSAISAAPLSGVPASVGMSAPDVGGQVAQQARDNVALSHPAVASFAASDPAKAAATKPDWSALANLTMTFDQYAKTGGPLGDISRAWENGKRAQAQVQSQVDAREANGGYDLLGRLQNFAATISAFSAPFAAISEPIARAGFAAKNAASTSDFLASPSVNAENAAWLARTPESRAREAEAVGGIVSAAVPLPIPALPKFFRRGPPIDLGFAHDIIPDPPLPPGRGLSGPEGSVPPSAPRGAPEFTDFSVEPSPFTSAPGVKPEEAPIFQGDADAHATAVTQMQEQIADMSTHQSAPALVNDFMQNHTEIGNASAWVDPQAVAALWQEGHQPFPDQVDAVKNAIDSGSQLEIPLSRYLSETAGQPFAEQLNAATRFSEDGVSQDEAKDLSAAREDIEGKPGIDARRMASMLGPQLYGDPTQTAPVTIKEVLQNSFDAIKSAMANGLDEGRIDITSDPEGRHLIFHDNGVGMDPELLSGKFLQIAGSQKGEGASGGFGIAKMLFLYGNDALHIQTLKNGVFSEMRTSGKDLMNALDGEGAKPTISVKQQDEIPQEIKDLFPEGHGTRISLQVPKTYIEPKTGETKDVPFPSYLPGVAALRYSPLFRNVAVRTKVQGQDFRKLPAVGSAFKHEEFTPFAHVQFPWGKARIYIERAKSSHAVYGDNLHVLSNGLWQFSTSIKKDPRQPYGESLPYKIYADIVPNVKPDEPGYPFNFNRQGLTDQAKKDFDKVQTYIQAVYGAKVFSDEAKSFGNVKYLQPEGGYTDAQELKPDIPPQENALDTLGEGDDVRVENGELIVNGRTVPNLNPEDLKKAIPDVNELKINQDLINPSQVMVHDNTVSPQGSITQQMEREFGPEWHEFLSHVGEAFMTLRNEVADIMGYDELKAEAVGISFDKSYRGVSIKIPFSGMFLNPLAAASTDIVESGYGIMTTMIHELAHFKVRSHDANFPAEMQSILAKLQASARSGGLDLHAFQERFVDKWERYENLIQQGRKIYDNDSLENSGKSFADSGSSESSGDEGDEGESKSLSGAREGAEGGPEVSEGAGKSTGAGKVRGPRDLLTEPAGVVEIPEDLKTDGSEIRTIGTRADSAVVEALKEFGISKLFTDYKALGISAKSFDHYGQAIDSLRAAVLQKVMKRTYTQLRRERTPEWKKQLDAIVPFMEQGLEANRDVAAMRQLTEKGFKLDRGTVEAFHPGSASRLPAGVLKANGNHPDAVADFLGYDSGAQMVANLADLQDVIKASGAKNLNEWVKAQALEAAQSQARSNLGYDVTPEGLAQAAREAVAEVPIEKYLTSDLKALAQEAGLPFHADDVKAFAQDQFDRLPTKTATNPRTFSRSMWKLGNDTQRALEKGDWAKAFAGRQKQFINYLQLQQSYAAAKQFRKLDNLLEAWSNKKFVKNMDPLSGAILQDAAGKMNYSLGRDVFELKRFLADARDSGQPWDVQSLNDAANVSGYPIEYLPQPDAAENSGELPPSMPWGDFRDYMASLQALAKYGAELHSIDVHGKEWALTDFANSVEASADALGRKWTAQELRDLRYTNFGKLRMTTQAILVSNLRPEVYLHWLDQQQQGPLMSIVNGLMKGKYQETDLSIAWTKAMREADTSGKLFSSMNDRLTIPDSMRVQTVRGPISPIENRGNLRMALMHLGSQSGAKKLLAGYGWGPEEERWLIAQATPEEWGLVKAFWAENDKLFELADDMYQRFRGHGLVKDPLRPVVTADGEVIPGGHIHIQYDSDLKDLFRIQDVNGVQATYGTRTPGGDVMSSHPAGALPSAFYSIKRTGFVGPVLLDSRAMAAGVAEVIHDIAFREALTTAQKGLLDPRVGDAMRTVLGPEYEKQMAPWLRYIAQEKMLYDPATEKFAKFVNMMTRNATWAEVAYSLSTSVKHSGVGLMHMLTETKNPLALGRAALDTMGFGPRVAMWQKFIEDNSGEVRGIKFNNDASISRILRHEELGSGLYNAYKENGFVLFTMFKQIEARMTWLAKYRISMSETGNHEASVNVADKAVRDTQGAGHSVDLAPFLRQGENLGDALKGLVAGRLMGFRNTTTNRIFTAKREAGQAGRKAAEGNAGASASFAGKSAAGLIGFVILSALYVAAQDVFLKGGGDPKVKTKGGKFAEEAGWGLGDQVLGAIPGGAQAFEALHYAESKGDPFSEALQNAKKAANPKGHRQIGLAVNAFGTLTGTIPIIAGNALQALYDEMHNDMKSEEYSLVPFLQRAVGGRAPHYLPSHSSRRSHR